MPSRARVLPRRLAATAQPDLAALRAEVQQLRDQVSLLGLRDALDALSARVASLEAQIRKP